jgi:hypothetical protein
VARRVVPAELQLVLAALRAKRRLPESSKVSQLTERLTQLIAVVVCSPQSKAPLRPSVVSTLRRRWRFLVLRAPPSLRASL